MFSIQNWQIQSKKPFQQCPLKPFTVRCGIFTVRPGDVYKAGRGLFRHVSFRETPSSVQEGVPPSSSLISEDEFYPSFANYLMRDLEECTKAIPLGHNIFRDKWGTPDVIGKEESKSSDIVKHERIIVSAEIKTDTQALIIAFGQACAYKVFSHKTYIVVPRDSTAEDKNRLESLCLIFGIGLIFFDNTNTQNLDFEIRVRAQKHEPDMFYVNRYMKMIEDSLFM